MTQPLIPEGTLAVDKSANFTLSKPASPQAVPPEAKDWDDFQAHMRRMTRPEDKGEIEMIPCVTPRGATFTAKVYKAKQKEWESDADFARRPGRVQELCFYRFPGDGMGTHVVDGKTVVTTQTDDLGMRTDPRNGARGPGKVNGDYTWPEEIPDALTRKIQIMKTYWHRDLGDYCGRPLPIQIRADHAAELEEFQAWKAAGKPKKPAK